MNAVAPTELDGDWQLLRAMLSGEEAPELVTTKTELRFLRGRYEVRFGGEITDCGAFELGAKEEKRTLTLRGAEGPNENRAIPALYQLVGNRLRICYGLDGVAPSGFAAHAGEARYLAVYSRRP